MGLKRAKMSLKRARIRLKKNRTDFKESQYGRDKEIDLGLAGSPAALSDYTRPNPKPAQAAYHTYTLRLSNWPLVTAAKGDCGSEDGFNHAAKCVPASAP